MTLRWLLAIVLLLPVVGSARTWRVEKDGSGDYTNIQPAVDAASPRDTVLVGPGRYDTIWLFDPILDWNVVVGVSVDSLTIIGTDRDAVIIGPSVYRNINNNSNDSRDPMLIGIAYRTSNTWGVVENITLENTDRGIHLYPSGEIRNCKCRGMPYAGLLAERAISILIENCEIFECSFIGIHITAYGAGHDVAVVRGCRVEGSQLGYYIGHPNAVIDNCMATVCNSGIAIMGGTSVISNVVVDGCLAGIVSAHNDMVYLSNSIIKNSLYSDLYVDPNGVLHGEEVELHGGASDHTIYVSDGSLSLHNSHIMPSKEQSVYILLHYGPDDAINLAGNYWGTTSADSIASWIWDGHDDPSILTTVRYEPFSPTPLPNENRSMGDVKAMFRR